jgi:hypothetical protein
MIRTMRSVPFAAKKIVVTRRRKKRSRSGVVSIKALARFGSGHTSSKRGKFTTGPFQAAFLMLSTNPANPGRD